MEELLSENWEVELELINWGSTAGPAYVLSSAVPGKWLPQLLLVLTAVGGSDWLGRQVLPV